MNFFNETAATSVVTTGGMFLGFWALPAFGDTVTHFPVYNCFARFYYFDNWLLELILNT